MSIKGFAILAIATSLGLPTASFATTILQSISAMATAANGQVQQQSDQLQSLYGTLSASASESTTAVVTYNNGEPVYATATSNVSMQANLAPGSLFLTASGNSGAITGVGDLTADAIANLEFDVTTPSVWTLTLTDNTSGYGDYTTSILNPAGQGVWFFIKSFGDPRHNQTVSLNLNPGLYQLQVNFGPDTQAGTGGDAGSLSLSLTSPVPLPASVWLLGSALGLLWAAYSTVTLFARLRGWSTSVPLRIAT